MFETKILYPSQSAEDAIFVFNMGGLGLFTDLRMDLRKLNDWRIKYGFCGERK